MDLIDLVHKMITNGNLKFAQLLRNALVEKVGLARHFSYSPGSVPRGLE